MISRPWFRVLLLSVLLASVTAVAKAPPKGSPGGAPHPEVDAAESCDGCHAELTPGSYLAWYAGRHGLMGVKCVLCHGSVGSGFTRKPKADRCAGCHGEKAEGVATGAFFKGKSCFTCHPPHALAPHGVRSGGAK